MAKRDAGEAMLAHLFGDDDSDGDSAYESSPSAGSVFSDGDSLFGELSVNSDDDKDMYGQSGCQDGDEPDDDAHTRVGLSVHDVAISTVSQPENNADDTTHDLLCSSTENRSSATGDNPSPSERGDAHSASVGPVIGENRSIIGARRLQNTQHRDDLALNVGAELAPNGDAALATNVAGPALNEEGDSAPGTTTTPPRGGGVVPSGRSKELHALLSTNDVVFISLDLETAGEEVGIVQLSAEIFRLDINCHKNTKGKKKGEINVRADTATNIRREPETFDEYVKPDSVDGWCSRSTAVHHLTPTHPSIVSAQDISTVWRKFECWVERHTTHDETAVLVAYHGEACDLKWIWKLTQAPRSTLSLPDNIKLFLDPHKVMSTKKSCKLHPSKSKTEGLSLSTVWSYINPGGLPDGQSWHNSLVDV